MKMQMKLNMKLKITIEMRTNKNNHRMRNKVISKILRESGKHILIFNEYILSSSEKEQQHANTQRRLTHNTYNKSVLPLPKFLKRN